MSALTAPVEDGVRDYLWTPINFGADTEQQRLAEADAFRAGVAWGQSHTDGRVLEGIIPGPVEARQLHIGDRVRVHHGEAHVTTKRANGEPDHVYIGARADDGREVLYTFRTSERVHVISGATAA
ncbi:hypothetical protein QE430_002511 [Microbacterium testaceum]|uniref:hypothetical protein n=1 Tax=Microbacterium testaceum TaxID=2033 RepID=UPI002781919C|nr:hypothetical protein [Microbacterium testaceum]MDQ1174204.1 hypothetical protein [Microbacterium testaceum]